jgi:hypothetical protein
VIWEIILRDFWSAILRLSILNPRRFQASDHAITGQEKAQWAD